MLLGVFGVFGSPQYRATIDRDRECIEIKKCWPLFRKRWVKTYLIAMIRNIEVKDNSTSDSSFHQVQWRQQDGSVVIFHSGYVERLRAEADAEIIRSFLNQDGRDIEIG
jgi:hypothetical protein